MKKIENVLNSTIFNNFVFIFKKKNIPFQYLVTIGNTSFLKNLNSITNCYKSISYFLKNISTYIGSKSNSGLIKFFSDFLLFFLLKKKNKNEDLYFSFLKNTKGIIKFIYPYISFFKEKAIFLFFFHKILTENKSYFEIEEFFKFRNLEKFAVNLIIETNQIFKIVNLTGVTDLDFYFKIYQNEFLTIKYSDLESFYHIYRKEKKIVESINTSRYLKQKAKLLLNLKESIENNTFEKIIIGCEPFEVGYFFKFFKIFLKKKKGNVNISSLFKNFLINNWIPNLLCLKFSFIELSYSNFMFRFFQNRSIEFSNLSNILELNVKKPRFDSKYFPQNFFNHETEVNKCFFFFNYTHSFYLGTICSYLQKNSFTFFFRFLENFPDQVNLYNFISKNGLFFDMKYIFLSNSLILLKIIAELLYRIDIKSVYEIKNINKNSDFYVNAFNETDFLLSISFFCTSNYSKMTLNLFMDSVDSYFMLFLLFNNNIIVLKNFEFLLISLVISVFNTNAFLNKTEYKTLKKNFEIIFIYFIKKEKVIKKFLTQERRNIMNEISFYSKAKIFELFLISSSILKHNLIDSNGFFCVKNMTKFALEIEIEFYFSYLNRSLVIFFTITLGIYSLKSKCKLVNILKDLEIISEKKFQKLCNLSILILVFFGTSNLDIISIIIKEYKNHEKQKFSKLERILLFKTVKNQSLIQSKSIPDTINEYENEQTFVTSKKYLELGIIGISLLTIGDQIASHMAMRIYGYFLLSPNLEIRRITTLAVGLLYISNPSTNACDYMIRLTNDNDWIIIRNAVFSLGLMGAGTGNSRIHTSLKCLADYYSNKIENFEHITKLLKPSFYIFSLKIQSLIFVIRIAQGLVNSLSKKILLSIFFGKNSLDFPKAFSLIYTIYGFSYSKFIGLNSISVIIFLLGLLVKPNLIVNINKNFQIKSVKLHKNHQSFKEKCNITPKLVMNWKEVLTFDNQKSFLQF
nr:hypothetical protein Cry52Nrm3_p021 [Cryptomonas curvata]